MKPLIDGAARARRLAGPALIVAGIIFLGAFLFSNASELQHHDWTVRPGLLLLSVVIQMVGLASGTLIWQQLLRGMSVQASYMDLTRVRFVSALTRFIPGKIWPFVGAARLAASTGIPATVTVTSLIAQTVFSLLGALLIAVYFLPSAATAFDSRIMLLRWLAPMLLGLAHPRIISAALRIVGKATRSAIGMWTGTWLDGVRLVAISVVGWLITGFALYLFVLSLTPLPVAALGPVIGANALAFFLGQAFFITPAGLGAKEGTMALVIALYVVAPAAALIAIAARIWTTLAELIIALLALRLAPADVRQ